MALIQNTILHTFPAELGFLPLDALRVNHVFLGPGLSLICAGQTGLSEQDEKAWNTDEDGRWNGPAPLRAVPRNLSIDGATYERIGADDVARLPEGTQVRARWSLTETGGMDTSVIAGYELILVNTLTKAVIYSEDNLAFTGAGEKAQIIAPSTTVPGSYLLCARIASTPRAFRLPSGYIRNDSAYKWGTSSTDYWDYTRNVGKLPPAGHIYYSRRAALLDSNTQSDRPEDADYIISDEPAGAEWSARLLIIGDGALQVAADFIPPCGPSLYLLTSVNARTPVVVDPMTRSGNVLRSLTTGTLYFAGQRMTPTGIVTALWELGVAGFSLIGTNLNPSTGACECALSNHGPTEILERPDGGIRVLTKCSKHKLDLTKALPEDRLPGTPSGSDGHPGGHSLRYFSGREYHTTENFGGTTFYDEHGNPRAQFYDYLVIQNGDTNRKGPGTVFHGTNDLCLWMGKLWGVMQDKANSDPDATQYITNLETGDWSLATSMQFPARSYRWQRVKDLQDGERNVLCVWGKRAGSEERLMGIADGRSLDTASFPWAIRRASVSPTAEDGKSAVLMPARAVTGTGAAAAIDTTAWHLVETKGRGNTVTAVCDDLVCACLCLSLEALAASGVTSDELPPVIVWYEEQKTWRSATRVPETGSRPYKELQLTDSTACYCGEGGPVPGGPGNCNGIVIDVLTGLITRVSVDPDTGAVTGTCDEPQDPPAGSEVVVIQYKLKPGEVVNAVQVVDAGKAGVLEPFNELYTAIRCRVDSEELAPEDVSTYPQVLAYSLWEPLYKPASSSVEVFIYLPEGILPVDVVLSIFVRN